MPFKLTSSAFREGEAIPRQFTCDGDGFTPPLAWSDAPDGTRGFALIMDDPDAPHGTFTHWLLYDIPAATAELTDQSDGKVLLHAVDVAALTLKGGTRKALERSLQAHTLATARLMGRYARRHSRSR